MWKKPKAENSTEKKQAVFTKTKTTLVGAAVAFTAITGASIDDKFEQNRYPIKIEYALIDTCLNGSSHAIPLHFFARKKESCICALEESMSEYPYSSYKENKRGFTAIFKEAFDRCD